MWNVLINSKEGLQQQRPKGKKKVQFVANKIKINKDKSTANQKS